MAFSLPYSKIMYNGRKLFENGAVNDSGQYYKTYIGNLNEIFEE